MSHRRIELLLRRLVAAGSVAVLLVPAARGNHALLGWLPLWLLGMPLASWWALRRFPLPARPARALSMPATRWRPPVQARRLRTERQRA